MANRGDLMLLSTRSMRRYMTRVANHLQTFPEFHTEVDVNNFIGTLKTLRFADGEIEVELKTSIRGKDVFLFGTSARNDLGLGVDECKIELHHAVDAIQRAQPERVTLIEPYCSSSRSDRTTRRNSVGFWVHYKTVMSLGIDHIITYQLHSDKSKTAVDPKLCAIDDVPAAPILQEFITDQYIRTPDYLEETVQNDWMFCSVDAGGESVARQYARAFGTKLIIAHKQRDYETVNTVESINILSSTDIAGHDIWIVDDMVDTAGSVYALVKELSKRNVRSVSIAVIHPVFSEPAIGRLTELYEDGLLSALVVTDTVALDEATIEALPCLEIVNTTRLSAEIIMKMHQERSLSPFFDPFDIRAYFSSMRLFL